MRHRPAPMQLLRCFRNAPARRGTSSPPRADSTALRPPRLPDMRSSSPARNRIAPTAIRRLSHRHRTPQRTAVSGWRAGVAAYSKVPGSRPGSASVPSTSSVCAPGECAGEVDVVEHLAADTFLVVDCVGLGPLTVRAPGERPVRARRDRGPRVRSGQAPLLRPVGQEARRLRRATPTRAARRQTGVNRQCTFTAGHGRRVVADPRKAPPSRRGPGSVAPPVDCERRA